MDVEDEANSYLKYLNDAEAPNAYLLENNEGELFSVGPIFTDIATTDWPQEGFPLLLTQSLIPEEECNNAINISTHLTSTEIEDLPSSATELPELIRDNDEPMLDQASSCLSFDSNELEVPNSVINDMGTVQLQQKIIQLVDADGTPIPINNSVFATINSSLNQQPTVEAQNSPKTVDDLFSTVLANKCKICSYLSEDIQQIKSHINVKHLNVEMPSGTSLLLSNSTKDLTEVKKELVVYVCSECHKVCTNKNDLREHMIESHGLVTEPEPPDPSSTFKETENKPIRKAEAYLDDINIGLVRKQEKFLQRLKCTVKGCLAGFPSHELRNKHEKLHVGTAKNMFNCADCNNTFRLWSIARSHMYTDHGIDFGMVVCPMCNIYKSYKPVRVLKHMMIHSEDKPYLCADCGKKFKQLAQLKNHEALHKIPEDMPTWSTVKQCPKCSEFFSNSKSLKCHIKTIHEQIKPFICNICGHKSSRKAMLELHMRQHTASKPYKCDYCNFRTGDHNSLRKHLMRHEGMVTYQCPYCPYSCIQAVSIKTHLQSKHKSKSGVYSCKHCSYTTINESSLRIHEKRHMAKSAQVASNEIESRNGADVDLPTDEETQSCFLSGDPQLEETVDKGGITIPAGLEMPLVS
ncbi:zinc finger protein 58-like isoform X2 [Euwallacea fornicatus]|uniref:zinc finger protein 58-like isoform X2 n=1 Tax=Euwallacea fornicatus TaxID=995702 RepID=UPI00338ED4FB